MPTPRISTSGFVSHSQTLRRPNRAAFSYLELLASLLVLGILAAVAVPEVSSALSRQRMRAAAQRVASTLRETIEVSRSTGESQEVIFEIGSPLIFAPGMVDSKSRTAPRILDLREIDPALVVQKVAFGTGDFAYFLAQRQGRSSTDGQLILVAHGRSIKITVKQGVVSIGEVL